VLNGIDSRTEAYYYSYYYAEVPADEVGEDEEVRGPATGERPRRSEGSRPSDGTSSRVRTVPAPVAAVEDGPQSPGGDAWQQPIGGESATSPASDPDERPSEPATWPPASSDADESSWPSASTSELQDTAWPKDAESPEERPVWPPEPGAGTAWSARPAQHHGGEHPRASYDETRAWDHEDEDDSVFGAWRDNRS
jgi:hypothetical protein